MFDVLISHREAQSIKSSYEGTDFFKTRSPKIYGIGKSYSAAMREVHHKIRQIAHYGNYQHATLDSLVQFQIGALTYVYPSVTFYRTEKNRE